MPPGTANLDGTITLLPELPEIECLTRAVRRIAKGGVLESARFLRPDLRNPIPMAQFRAVLEGESITDVRRRSKYMLIKSPRGYGIFHLGMSGHMICYDQPTPVVKHTHAIFTIKTKEGVQRHLHFVDPRRFGLIDCHDNHEGNALDQHVLFRKLGVEPLGRGDLGNHLFTCSRGRKTAIKTLLMDAHIVVGVGNIYANESLFRAGIRPTRPAGRLSQSAYRHLASQISIVLKQAIRQGGTTFRDFRKPDGKPGYFRVSLQVYGREGEPCHQCGRTIRHMKQSNRSSYFCSWCQK